MTDASGLNTMAIGATLHCLAGCSIGEIVGLVVGAAVGLNNVQTVVMSTALAFGFGFALSMLPLVKGGLAFKAALAIVLAADALSIATMEIADNAVMTVIPGAMNATLVQPLFWISMALSLTLAFWAAFPVNRYLLTKGKGHALVHEFHQL